MEHRFRPKLLVLISTHDKLVIRRFDGCNFSCFADSGGRLPPSLPPSLTVSRNKHARFHGVFSQFGKAKVPVYRAKFSANGRMKIAGCFRCKFHRLFIRGYLVKTLFPVTRLNKRLICMRVEWGDPLGVETEKRRGTIILLVHRVSNVRVVKERRGRVLAGCYEYNENVSCRRAFPPPSPLSLTVRDKLCNPADVIYATLLVSISSSRFMLDFES